jgi:FMN phosphatase YigB (HAD superfamily)
MTGKPTPPKKKLMSAMNDVWDIGVDLDGCAYDFVEAIRVETRLHFPHLDSSSEARSWTFYESWGLTAPEFLELYAQGVRGGRVLWQGEPYPGTVEAWQSIAGAGHRIHVITDRQPPGAESQAREATLYWLEQCSLPYTSISFSPDKTLIARLAEYRDRTMFVDDKHENHVALQTAGIRSFLLDRPWNQQASGPRVRDLAHYAGRIAELSGRSLAQT